MLSCKLQGKSLLLIGSIGLHVVARIFWRINSAHCAISRVVRINAKGSDNYGCRIVATIIVCMNL